VEVLQILEVEVEQIVVNVVVDMLECFMDQQHPNQVPLWSLVVVAVVPLLLVDLEMLLVVLEEVHRVVTVETHLIVWLDLVEVLVVHRAVLAVVVQVLDLLVHLLDLHYKVEQVDKVLDHFQTGLVAAVAVLDTTVAAVAVVVMTMVQELVLLLVVGEDLDT